jgi:hypothetical protein
MMLPRPIGVQFALALAAYHRRLGTRVPDGDLGFRCPACDQPLVAREWVSHRAPSHFDHIDVFSTCRLTRFAPLTRAKRSETLDFYLTPEAFRTIMRDYQARVSDDGDETGEGDARVPSPLRPAPFDRTSSASVLEPDDDVDVAAVSVSRRPTKDFYSRCS